MKGKVLEVPKIKQLDGYCLPASLSMVLAYWGMHIDQEEIGRELEARDPEYQEDAYCDQFVLPYARSLGFIAHPHSGSTIDKIVSWINREVPLIVSTRCLLNLKMPHASVVRGYDLGRAVLLLNDPGDMRRSKITFQRFTHIWRVKSTKYGDADNYMISIRPRN